MKFCRVGLFIVNEFTSFANILLNYIILRILMYYILGKLFFLVYKILNTNILKQIYCRNWAH